MVNKDGGAHVDPKIPTDYERLTRAGSMGWRITDEGVVADIKLDGSAPEPGTESLDPVPASVRQITHEVLTSLKELHPELVTYAQPEPSDE